MAKPETRRQITIDEVRAAVAAGSLAAQARRLAQERNWVSVGILFAYAGGPRVPLPELAAAVRAVSSTVAVLPEVQRGEASAVEGARAGRLAAAEAILRRVDDPTSEAERDALCAAADALLEAGDARRAAITFERAGNDGRAADAYGAVGDLERMETCLARDEARRTARRSAVDAVRRFEALVASGERAAAILAAGEIPDGSTDAAAARRLAQSIDARLCRGRAISLRLGGGRTVRFAAMPCLLGRDAFGEIVLRDPGVSRRHAVIRADGDDLVLEDAGSRAGTRLAGVPIAAALRLGDAGEIGLGEHCRLSFRQLGSRRIELRGTSGIDRSLHAIVGAGPLPLYEATPEASGLLLALGDRPARLTRDLVTAVRVDGRFIGQHCDLMHGDLIEGKTADSAFRIEVA